MCYEARESVVASKADRAAPKRRPAAVGRASLNNVATRPGDFKNDPDPSEGTGDTKTLAALRAMLLKGDLRPGSPISQRDVAKTLGLSRIPVREAFASLLAEGVITHHPGTGYSVTQYDADDLQQLYLMRTLLEAQLLKTMRPLTPADVAQLREAHENLIDAAERSDVQEITRANRRFHFTLFNCSPLNLVCREVENLWNLSEFYRSLYLYDPKRRAQIIREHDEIMRTAADGDYATLVKLCRRHTRFAERALMTTINHEALDSNHEALDSD
jgi:DNA-binding GntR family transcriptional regulator